MTMGVRVRFNQSLHFFAVFLTAVFFIWYAVYLILGSTDLGRGYYKDLGKQRFTEGKDYKGGILVETLSYPLFLAGSFTTLLLVAPSVPGRGQVYLNRFLNPSWLLCFYRNTRTRFTRSKNKYGGDPDYNWLSFWIVGVPSLLYAAARVHRHLIDDEAVFHELHADLANDFGKLGVVAMAWFLIPVSRHSAILTACGWDPIAAVRLHIWGGYLAVFGGLFHGVYWMVNWWMQGERMLSMIFPPKECYSPKTYYDFDGLGTVCRSENTYCDCHGLFVNLIGIAIGVFFIILTITSLHWVRRNFYKVFYIAHIIFGTLIMFGLVMHWKRMILYICPSIFYYCASTLPTLVQAAKSYVQGGTVISHAEHIPDSGDCVEICLLLDPAAFPDSVTALQTTSTQYVRICVPSVSPLFHPFTIYSKPGDRSCIRIIFRCYGSFTHGFSDKLRLPQRPKILVDGYYSGADRLTQALSHDTVVMVAGGIGIVSYMSMIYLLNAVLTNPAERAKFATRKVILHWICRDEGLIQYIAQRHFSQIFLANDDDDVEHLRTLSDPDASGVRFHIIVHHTTKNLKNGGSTDSTSTVNSQSNSQVTSNSSQETLRTGRAMVPAYFAPHTTVWQNIPSFLLHSFISWYSLRVCWQLYIIDDDLIYDRTNHIWVSVGLAVVSSLLLILVLELIAWVQKKVTTDPSTFRMVTLPGTPPDYMGAAVPVDHQYGRPNMGALMEEVMETSENPGVFMCGPEILLQTVRDAWGEVHLLEMRAREGRGAIYEETFEL